MLNKLRERAQGESGFTLIELLVVMLIIGLLAAIAIPSFFNQREKAQDADAKETVRTAQTAAETYSTDNGGVYSSGSGSTAKTMAVADLTNIESSLSNATLAVSGVSAKGYTVQVTSKTGNVFQIVKNGTTGAVTYPCTTATTTTPANTGGGCSGGKWNG